VVACSYGFAAYGWGVTDKSMGSSDSIQELHFAHDIFPCIVSSQYPGPAWMWITQEFHIPYFFYKINLFYF